MNSERIKEIQQGTAYPDSISVQQALLQVWNECEQQERMYSDIQEYAEFCVQCFIKNLPCITAKTWFEQNKKK